MPIQTEKKTLLANSNVALDTLDPSSFYDVTLSGFGLNSSAHANLAMINSVLKGDTLRALGSNNTLTGGAGKDLLISAGANNLLVAGAGADTLVSGSNGAGFLISNAAQLSVNSISGGSGSDTLRLGTGIRAADSQFSKIRGVEVLSLGGGSSVTLAVMARTAGISSVVTGVGGGTVQGASYNGSLTLEAGGAGARALLSGSASQANLFRASAGALATATMNGGVRNDTLSILSGGGTQISDSLFANLSRIDTLLLPGGGQASVTLGAGAQRAGITTVVGSDDGISIRQEQRQTRAMTLVGGSGDDLFSFSSTARAAANSIVGGGGIDTIQVDTGTMADPFFRKVSDIEVLSLGSASSVTLGNTASSKGLQTIVASAQNVTVQAGAMEAQLTLDASAAAGRVSLNGSAGGSLFLLGDADALASSTLRGGVGADTLTMTRVGTYSDSSFARMRGIEEMHLAGGGNNVVLGNAAAMSGLSTLIAGSAGGDTITQTAGGYYLDASAAVSGVYIDVANPGLLAGGDKSPATTIVGGAGTDTLVIGAGDFSDLSFFSNISGVETILFAGLFTGGAITLDGALAEFFTTIAGSSGPMTFTQTDGAFYIDGREGDPNVFDLLADGNLLIDDTILGGDGIDSLFLGEASFDEDPFTNVKGVEFVSLTGSSSIILGEAAAVAGVSSLYGGEDGDSTLQVDAGFYYLNGAASSSNLFVLSDSSLVGENTIVGNNDSDTLSVGSGVLRDADFSNLSGVPIIHLASDATLQFGALASEVGLATLYGGEGDAGVELLTGGLDVEAGDATGTFLVNAADSGVMEASTFVGNGEGSTLSFDEGQISDEAFANVSNVGTVLLVGSSEITLTDAAANAGIVSVIGGSGDMIFNQSAGSFLLDGSGGESNLFAIASSDLLADDTIIGAGEGADTLAITEEDSFDDDSFANITGVSLLSLSGSSSATLGSAISDAGITELIVGDGDSTILLDEGAPAILLDGQYASSLLVGFTDSALAAETTLYGGEGADTLAFGAADTIADEAFTNVSGFEVISVTDGSSLILGAAAAAANLDSIYGGTGINTITQTAENANSLLIDGGSGQLRVELENYYYLLNDTILGGTSTLGNTLSVGGAGTILDSYFTNISDFGTLELEGDNNVVLGSQASLAGITRVNVNDGDNSFTISSGGPSGVTLDASSGTGDNRFTFDSVNQLSTARILGADGDDTLAFANQGMIADTLFGRAEGIEVLQLSGASEVTLGTYAAAAGVVTVNGGTGGTTFMQDSLSMKSYYLDGSADQEYGNRFVIAKAGQVASDTLLGGSGIDTLRVETGSIIDSSFANVSAVEVLQLTGSGSVVLGNNADLSGLFSVVGGMGQNQFTHAQASDLSYFLDGSLGSNNLFSVADALHASIDTFVGGVGTDTVKIGEDVIDDSAFLNHRFVEVLQLSGTSVVTLGSAATSAGISMVYGGSGATSLDASAMTGALVIDAGAGSGSSFLKAGSGADNITGGSGTDTLTGWASDANTATDTLFGGAGADLFVLGDEAGNGYGDGASKAIISDFAGGTDYLQLHDYGTGSSSYRVDATAGSGYTHQLFDINSGSDVLVANIDYTGSDASGDLLGARALFA